MAPADPPSTVPGAPGLHNRSADDVDDPALLDLAVLEDHARGALAVVSEQGRRQPHRGAAALPEIAAAVGDDDVEVHADGGIRTGPDVLTALALGATAVFLGRPAIWGLAIGGADGVSRVLTGLSAQLAHTMVLCGLSDVRAVPRDTVTPAR